MENSKVLILDWSDVASVIGIPGHKCFETAELLKCIYVIRHIKNNQSGKPIWEVDFEQLSNLSKVINLMMMMGNNCNDDPSITTIDGTTIVRQMKDNKVATDEKIDLSFLD